jgi:hypothetical protein
LTLLWAGRVWVRACVAVRWGRASAQRVRRIARDARAPALLSDVGADTSPAPHPPPCGRARLPRSRRTRRPLRPRSSPRRHRKPSPPHPLRTAHLRRFILSRLTLGRRLSLSVRSSVAAVVDRGSRLSLAASAALECGGLTPLWAGRVWVRACVAVRWGRASAQRVRRIAPALRARPRQRRAGLAESALLSDVGADEDQGGECLSSGSASFRFLSVIPNLGTPSGQIFQTLEVFAF